MIRTALYLFLTLFLTAHSIGATFGQVTVNNEQEVYPLRGKCKYYLDKENLTFDQVFEKPFDTSYSKEWYQHMGYLWISFEIENQSDCDAFMLSIDQWEVVEFYHQRQGKWIVEHSGTTVPVVDRPESLHRLLTFPVHQPTGTKVTYYLKVRTSEDFNRYYLGVYDFLSKLEWSYAVAARDKYILNLVIIFFVLGLCFALLIFNGVRVLLRPGQEQVLLFAYIIVTAVFIANIHGVATNYLFPFAQAFELKLGFVLVHVSSILIALYVRAYLKTTGKEIENILLLGMAAFMLLSLVYALADGQPHWYYMRRYIEGCVVGLTLIIAIFKGRKGVYYLLGAFFFALSGRYVSEYLSGYDLFVWGDIPYLIGFLVQLALFSAGSSVRLESLEKEVQKALVEKQQLLEDQNRRLNVLVKERTAEIQVANEEVSERNQELRKTIDELKNTQQRLIETENMAVIGQLTGGIAHELNNPLNVIGGMVQPIRTDIRELRSALNADPKLTDELFVEITNLLDGIESATKKATSVVRNLGMITPGRMFQQKSKVDVTELLADLVAIMRDKFPEIKFHMKTSQPILTEGWREELGKMIENVILNGVDAIDKTQGMIVIDLIKKEEEVTLTISDNGPGMEPEVQRHIFEPFFTTKNPGKGTGLGLFIARAIAVKHGGNITVSSTPGQGSAFIISLPPTQ